MEIGVISEMIVGKWHRIKGKEPVCANCRHYLQHYIRVQGNVFAPCDDGHCMEPRLKNRKPENTCEHWESKWEETT